MTNTDLRETVRRVWHLVWAARWAMAAFAYLCAMAPGGLNWDWFVVGPMAP